MAIFGKKAAVLLALALLLALVFQFAHPSVLSDDYRHLPGIGLMLSQWTAVAAILLIARKEKKLLIKGNLQGIFLLVISMGLGLCYGIFANDGMRAMNLPVLIAATAQALFSLAGSNRYSALSGQGLWEAVRRFFPSLFQHFSLPFHAAAAAAKEKHPRMQGLALGVALCIPAALVAIVLLSSADGVFGSIIEGAVKNVGKIDGEFVRKVIFSLLLGLMLFSFLLTAGEEGKEFIPGRERTVPAAVFVPALGILAVVYGLFLYVQFRYLFGTAQTAFMAGGYAEYARSGFFQLVLLALLTLLLILPSLSLCEESKAVRGLCALVAAFTVIIDFSAFYRMRMYIQCFGLSLLRVLTLWGMLAIFAALALCIAKCFRPSFRICPSMAVAVLVSWLMLNFCNVDARVAQYNVHAYNTGILAELDAAYLAQLSPDVMPALKQIQDENVKQAAIEQAMAIWEKEMPCAYDWSLSWLQKK